MKTFTLSDGTTQYKRVNKTTAKKLWKLNTPVILCPVKLYPFGSWCPSQLMSDKQRIEESGYTFDQYVANFEYYNCNCYETGYYTAFYIPS